MTRATGAKYTSVSSALAQKIHVMNAVMLRDIKTRFFDHALGFLIIPLWPLTHMVALLVVYHAAGRQSPYGDSLNIFFTTGLIPTLLFMYVSRFMAMSLVANKPMLAFPVVKIVDIMIARAFLETIGAVLTLAMLLLILWLVGDTPMPYDLEQAVLAYLATLLLAVGVGSIIGVLSMITPVFLMAYSILMILVYLSSGTLFVASTLPDQFAIPLSWSPVIQSVEWMRTAYFETYPDRLVDKTYLLQWGLGSLFIGLLLERLLRLRLLE